MYSLASLLLDAYFFVVGPDGSREGEDGSGHGGPEGKVKVDE
jgi:hypothetical protein